VWDSLIAGGKTYRSEDASVDAPASIASADASSDFLPPASPGEDASAPSEEKKGREEGDILEPKKEREIVCETFARRQEGVGQRAAGQGETAVGAAPAGGFSAAAGPFDRDILAMKNTAIRILDAIGDAWQTDAARPVLESTCRGVDSVTRAMNLFLAPRKPSPLKPFVSFSKPGRTAPHAHTGAQRHHEVKRSARGHPPNDGLTLLGHCMLTTSCACTQARSRLMALSEKSRSIIAKPREAAARIIREQDKYRQQLRERLDREYPQTALGAAGFNVPHPGTGAGYHNVPPPKTSAVFYNVPPKTSLEASNTKED
jgi:hypothetical protein